MKEHVALVAKRNPNAAESILIADQMFAEDVHGCLLVSQYTGSMSHMRQENREKAGEADKSPECER